jgi:hypothetical protein
VGYQPEAGSEIIGRCWMTNPQKPNENVFVHMILLTPEGPPHLLLSMSDGSPFLFKGSDDLITLVGYVCDPSLPSDITLDPALLYFAQFGPYGEIATLKSENKRISWIDDDFLAPVENTSPLEDLDIGYEESPFNDSETQEIKIGGGNRCFIHLPDADRLHNPTFRYYTSPLIAGVQLIFLWNSQIILLFL